MIGALVIRDIRITARSGGTWLLGLVFFLVFLTLCAIAFGGDLETLKPVAAPLIWLSVIFSTMLSFGTILNTDYQDGTLEPLLLSGLTPLSIAIAKAITYFLTAIAPLIITAPLAGLVFDLPIEQIKAVCFSLLFAAPAIATYGVFASAVMIGRGSSGFLIVLLTAPFLIPVLIFGVAAVDSYARFGLSAVEFRALAGLSLIACAAGLPAAGAALKANLE